MPKEFKLFLIFTCLVLVLFIASQVVVTMLPPSPPTNNTEAAISKAAPISYKDKLISAEDAKKLIKEGKSLVGYQVAGNLDLSDTKWDDLNLTGLITKKLILNRVIASHIYLGHHHIDQVIVDGAQIGSFISGCTTVKFLAIRNSTIMERLDLQSAYVDMLSLQGSKLPTHIDLAFGKTPELIYVDASQTERVHVAAPTVPLVVVNPHKDYWGKKEK